MNFEELMLRAVTNAETFKYTAKPNPVVGAILCNDNEIISEGYHEIYGSNHAEINAISNARKHQGKKFNNFSELALVCTLEPKTVLMLLLVFMKILSKIRINTFSLSILTINLILF